MNLEVVLKMQIISIGKQSKVRYTLQMYIQSVYNVYIQIYLELQTYKIIEKKLEHTQFYRDY